MDLLVHQEAMLSLLRFADDFQVQMNKIQAEATPTPPTEIQKQTKVSLVSEGSTSVRSNRLGILNLL